MGIKQTLRKLQFVKNILAAKYKILEEQKKYTNVEFKGNNEIDNCDIGEFSYISKNSIIHNAVIGRFCSIGPNVVIGYGDHPTTFLSTSPRLYFREIFDDLELNRNNIFVSNSTVNIGNDVWIGANCFIKNGVTIGDGAIIGAGAIVTGDVKAYSINVGVPSKILKYRFTEQIISRLLELRWWKFSIETIRKIEPLLSQEIDLNTIDLIEDILNNK